MSIWLIGALLFGLVVGSFANVCIHRIPLGQSIVWPGSRCPRCGAPIRAWDNVPILSYVWLLGRCRACRAHISLRYPLVEAANGLLYLAVALVAEPGPHAVVTMGFLTALLILSLIDLEHYILPNAITLPGIALGLAASLLPDSPIRPKEALASAVGAYVLLALFGIGYQKLRGIEGLGQGDWKMMAMLGAFLGIWGTLLTLLLASVAGVVVGTAIAIAHRGPVGKQRIPLGTFMGMAAIIVVFAGQDLVAWYRRIAGA